MVSGWQAVPGFRWLADLVRGLLARRWVRFGIVGGAASVSYFLLGLLFVNVAGLPTLAGNALAYALSFIVSYLGHACGRSAPQIPPQALPATELCCRALRLPRLWGCAAIRPLSGCWCGLAYLMPGPCPLLF